MMACGMIDSDSVTSGISRRLRDSHRTSLPQHWQRIYKGVQQRGISVLRSPVPHVHSHDADCSHM